MKALASSHSVESLEARVLRSSPPLRVHTPLPGSLDVGFGNAGVAAGVPTVQPDGKIVFGPVAGLFRALPDGSADPAFGNGGFLALPTFGQARMSFDQVAVQSDGKIVLAGVDDNDHLALARLNDDGSLDGTFGDGGWINDSTFTSTNTSTLNVQRDGKIIVVIAGNVLRFNTDGSTDSTFGIDGRVALGSFYPSSLTLTPDDHLLLCGRAPVDEPPALSHDFELSELNTDGSMDTSFGSSGVLMIADVDFASTPHVLVSDDGRITVATNSFSGPSHVTIRRLTSLGSADLTFGHQGKAIIRVGGLGLSSCAIAATAGGGIAVAASEVIGTPNLGGVGQNAHDVPFRAALFELTPNGRRNYRFGQQGKVSHGAGRGYLGPTIFLAPDGGDKLIVQCNTFLGRFYIS